jgi:hypothetical protein
MLQLLIQIVKTYLLIRADDYGVFKVTKGDFGEFYARFDIPGNSTRII